MQQIDLSQWNWLQKVKWCVSVFSLGYGIVFPVIIQCHRDTLMRIAIFMVLVQTVVYLLFRRKKHLQTNRSSMYSIADGVVKVWCKIFQIQVPESWSPWLWRGYFAVYNWIIRRVNHWGPRSHDISEGFTRVLEVLDAGSLPEPALSHFSKLQLFTNCGWSTHHWLMSLLGTRAMARSSRASDNF